RVHRASPLAFSGGIGSEAQLNWLWLPSGVSWTGTRTRVCTCMALFSALTRPQNRSSRPASSAWYSRSTASSTAGHPVNTGPYRRPPAGVFFRFLTGRYRICFFPLGIALRPPFCFCFSIAGFSPFLNRLQRGGAAFWQKGGFCLVIRAAARYNERYPHIPHQKGVFAIAPDAYLSERL